MKKYLIALVACSALTAAAQQTMWVCTGQVKYAFTTDQLSSMPFATDLNGSTLTVLDKTFAISEIDSIYVDSTTFADDNIAVDYSGTLAVVTVSGNIAAHITAAVNGAHATVLQDETVAEEYTYTLAGNSSNGSFYHDGSYKVTLVLNGLTLHNPDSAAINIRNGKRIGVTLNSGTVNTLTDGTGGSQKACFTVKGHTEFKGAGTLNITGNTGHAFWGKEYVQLKKSLGTINILGAVGDGFNVNQYFQQDGGTVNISGVGDDGIQLSFETDDNDVVLEEEENTGEVIISGGSTTITTTGDATKGFKVASNFKMSGGSVNITQTGSIVVENDDISYSTGVKADGDIQITGGSITINNTASGGKGLSADGNISIDESAATTTIDITANGEGGTAETAGSGDDTPTASYKVYVSLPTSGGGGPGGGSNAWSKVYLYRSDGTLVQQLTSTVSKTSGYSTVTFYYYDFGAADSNTYYFKSDDYTRSGGGWGGGSGTTYTIKSVTFTGPTSGTDVYYSISNSYSTSGTTRTYSMTNVTSTYGGSNDMSEDQGTSYNASGLKADGNITIDGGTITVANSGAMSKSIKSKATVTINGGTITLTPSGAMKVINNDASYSSGVKCVNFVLNGGSLTINSSGVAGKGVSATGININDGTLSINNTGNGSSTSNGTTYSGKGLKADGNMVLAGGDITISMSGTGGKGIKVNGAYTQGTADGNGPNLTVTTTGSAISTGSGGGGFGPGGGSSVSGSSKAIKVLGQITIYGGTTEVNTATNGAEGLESKTAIYIEGGQHYFKSYDDCINSSGKIFFNGGVTVCYSNGNDAVDSNAGTTGAVTIGNGAVMAYTSAGGPEEGFDCDNNSYVQITGTGIAISAGGAQGGGFGGNSISGAKQGYAFVTSSVSYTANRYYTLQDGSNKNLVTFSFPVTVSSSLSLFTATGMTSGSTYYVKYNTANTAPTDATTSFHGLYLGSSLYGTSQTTSMTAQ